MARVWIAVALTSCTSPVFLVGRPAPAPAPLVGPWDGPVFRGDEAVGSLIVQLDAEGGGLYTGIGELDDLDDQAWSSFTMSVGDPGGGSARRLKVALTDCLDGADEPAPCEEIADPWVSAAGDLTGDLPDLVDLGPCRFDLGRP